MAKTHIRKTSFRKYQVSKCVTNELGPKSDNGEPKNGQEFRQKGLFPIFNHTSTI